ncbi:MAG: polysaccharide biosynthesis C-terminal domain-containing protein, partial [Gammaproteobacteria bacterium]|nr:polysaccharide biosynthesis C-terminal domain-containing protein [Gammaproteobacteria bacterium]
WIGIAAAAVTTLVLLLGWGGALTVGAPDWVMTALIFAAASAPPLMIYSFLRRASYQTKDHTNILVMASVHVMVYAIGVAVAFFQRDVQSIPFMAFAAAPAIGALIGLVRLRKNLGMPPRSMFNIFYRSIHFTKWSFLSGMVGSVYSNGMNIIIAAFLGAVGSAMFAATRTMVAPIISLVVATDMIDKPHAGRAFVAGGIPGLRRSVRNTLALLVLLGGPYLMFVFVFSGSILEFVFGTKYAGLEWEMRVWALVMLLHMVANPLATHLITLKNTKSIFHSSIAGALVALAVATPLLDTFGIIAALIGMSSGRLVNVLLLYFATRRTYSKDLPIATSGGKGTHVHTSPKGA